MKQFVRKNHRAIFILTEIGAALDQITWLAAAERTFVGVV
jgi:hypothetical protein